VTLRLSKAQYLQGPEVGDSLARRELARSREESGDRVGAEAAAVRAVDLGDDEAPHDLG
jgi:hypothetical protein